VPAPAEWEDVVQQLRASADPLRSPGVGLLYELAIRDGERFLASFRGRLDEERIRDLIHDLLAEKLRAIVHAPAPRAFFCVSLQRRAISWLRRGDAAVEEAAPEGGPTGEAAEAQEERRAFMLDAERVLHGLSARDRGVLAAVGWGGDREVIAEQRGITRANVDQIVSRANRRFRRGEP